MKPRAAVLLAAILGCRSGDAPAPPPPPKPPVPAPATPPPAAAPVPASQLIEAAFGKPSADAFLAPDQLAKLRELARTASPADKPLVDKMVQFAEDAARDPKDYDGINRRYVALVGELVPALGPGDFKLALELVGSTYPVWSSTRYHGGFELDAPVGKLFADLATAHPDEPVPQALLARFMSESGLDDQAGLAAAKRCTELAPRADASVRAPLDQECRRMHGDLAGAFTAPRCTAVRDDLAFYRGGPRKSEIDPTQPVVVDGRTFHRGPKPLTSSGHVTAARKDDPATLTFVLDAEAAHAAEDLRGGVVDEDDWIIVEAGGKPLLAGHWDLDFGRLVVAGDAAHAPKLELVCKTIERRTVPATLALQVEPLGKQQ